MNSEERHTLDEWAKLLGVEKLHKPNRHAQRRMKKLSRKKRRNADS